MKKLDRQTTLRRLEAFKTHLLDPIIETEPDGSPCHEKAETTRREIDGIIAAIQKAH